MAKFNNLKKLDISAERTAEMTLYALEGEPVLILAPATEANKPYFNALLRRNRKNMGRIQQKQITAAMTKENRDDDRKLYAEHIARGWRGVIDDDGNPVTFNKQEALDFFEALPDHLFDEVRLFATAVYNFLDDEAGEAGDTSGNSQNA